MASFLFQIVAEAKVANEAANPIKYESNNVFFTHQLWTSQDSAKKHEPSRKEKENVRAKAQSYQYYATERYEGATVFVTCHSITRGGDGLEALKAAARGHCDAIFKAFIDIWAFRDHYLYPDRINKAITETKPNAKKKNWHDWARSRQHKVQLSVLGWALEYVRVFVKETDEDGAWSNATRAQRREALAACFDEAPLYIAKRMFNQVCRRVDIYQIYGVDEEKVPEAKEWRRSIRMMFIDVCDKTYTMMVRPKKFQMSHKQHREQLWKTMTRSRKYRSLRSRLGQHKGVPVYAEGLEIHTQSNYFTNEKVRNKIKKKEAGIPKGPSGRKRKVVDAEEAGPGQKCKWIARRRVDDSITIPDGRAGMKGRRCKSPDWLLAVQGSKSKE